MPRHIGLLMFVLQLLLLTVVHTYDPSDACESMEIRTINDFQSLRQCRYVVGYVHVVNLNIPVPESLNSKVEEISDYLLVHRSHGLKTLQHLFPRLRLIRGRELFANKYALIVYENRYLQDLGLISLMRIQSGDIRVESNPVLCYVHTINWIYLMGNSKQQRFYLKKNRNQNFCRYCSDQRTANALDTDAAELELPNVHRLSTFKDQNVVTAPINQSCWSFGVYQRKVHAESCFNKCGIAGCDSNGTCCSRDCISGCSASKCDSCANLQLGEKCVNRCNMPFIEVFKRECIDERRCRKSGMFTYASTCVEDCPAHHQLRANAQGHRVCTPMCKGLFLVHTSEDLGVFKACSLINGSVIIELTEMKSRIVMDLESAFINIREITGYLKVVRSPQLVSFHFLRNLDTIRGDELIDNKYSLYVVDNHHLEHIWDQQQNVAIQTGRIYFHLNPRLCSDKILMLQKSMRSPGNITTAEASPNSNGERVICSVLEKKVLKPLIEAVNATAVCIKLEPWSTDDLGVLLGYMHRYKEAPLRNVTMYDGRHGCGQDSWHMDTTYNVNVRHIIANLKPNTQYAYYVKAITMFDYHYNWDAYTNISYFITLPSKPGPVAKIYYQTETATAITFHWWPPRNPNGAIRNYLVSLKRTNLPVKDIADDYVLPTQSRSTCKCRPSPDDSGALPKDKNYYEEDKLLYEEQLPNIIYYKRSKKTPEVNTTTAANITTDAENTTASATTITSSSSSSTTTTTTTTKTTTTNSVPPPLPGTSLSTMYPFFETTNADMDEETRQRIQRWNEYQLRVEQRAFHRQDNGNDDFIIQMPMPVCPYANADEMMQYQLENLCVPLEHFEGIAVDGHAHAYTFDKLEPGVAYEFSIRACVEGLENGCGKATTTMAKTASKSWQIFLKENPSSKSIDDQSTYF